MPKNNQYTFYVREAIVAIKLHIDKYPLKYKTSEELLLNTSVVNRRILEKAFKHIYGYRIKGYQVKQRLLASKGYLKEGMPIKRVAIKCLYKSQSAFSRAFKREFNETPTEWLRA